MKRTGSIEFVCHARYVLNPERACSTGHKTDYWAFSLTHEAEWSERGERFFWLVRSIEERERRILRRCRTTEHGLSVPQQAGGSQQAAAFFPFDFLFIPIVVGFILI